MKKAHSVYKIIVYGVSEIIKKKYYVLHLEK